MTLKIIRLSAAVLALGGMVAIDLLQLSMSAAVAALLGAVVQRYLLPQGGDKGQDDGPEEQGAREK